MIYFISDLHFYHRNVINFGSRPFKDELEMNNKLIENWNSRVHESDSIYVLGDMFVRSKSLEEIENVLSKLNGKKYLIVGNHDRSWLKKYPSLKSYFKEVCEEKTIHYTEGGINRTVILSHYPKLEWEKYYRGSFHIFGHIHNKKDEPQLTYLRLQDKMFNAAVEVNNYKPVTFNELVINNKVFYNRE